MTATLAPETAPAKFSPEAITRTASGAARWLAAAGGALVVFGVFMWLKGASPLQAYADMFRSLADMRSLGDILIKATPVCLAALAVAVPARAGLINVGGEGQLMVGGVAACGVALGIGDSAPGGVTIVVMLVAAAVAGALWAAVAAGLRLAVGISESVTTLLMNYLAFDLLAFLCYDRWKDRKGSGQPATRPLAEAAKLPLIGDSRVHVGAAVAAIAVVLIALVLRKTAWGFKLNVVGGNPEAGRRAGLRVGTALLSAMLVGGALAGIGGFTQYAGAEYKLRPGFLATYGYTAFLASWLGRHKPIGVLVASLLLSAIAIGGDSLQIDSRLPAASVNVLMALVLLGVFGWGRARTVAGAA